MKSPLTYYLIAFLAITSCSLVAADNNSSSYDHNNNMTLPIPMDCDTIVFYLNGVLFEEDVNVCKNAIHDLALSPNVPGTFSSSSPKIGFINPNAGNFLFLDYGCASFTFTDSEGCVYTSPEVCYEEFILVELEEYEVCVGQSTFIAKHHGTSYTTDNNAIAIISNSGLITCVDQGTTTITGYDTQGCVSLPSQPLTCLPCSCTMEFTEICTNSYNEKVVCTGDTSQIFFSETCDYTVFPFIPDFLELENGKLLSYEEDNFTVEWGDPGFGEAIYFLENSNGVQEYISTSVTILDKNEIIIYDNDNNTDQQEICTNESIILHIDNSLIEAKWIINDGRILFGKSIDLHFDFPGVYTVECIDNRECNCTQADTFTITVLEGNPPIITCPRPMCIGEEMTYYSEQECDQYLWSVSSDGTIIDGGGNNDYFITIQWNSGVMGEISLETPSCSSTNCNNITTEEIPIISPTATITGKDIVCSGEVSSYLAPLHDGSYYTWDIPSNGTILSGQGGHHIKVLWNTNTTPTYTSIKVEYENCNLGCSGQAELPITILGNISIISPSISCIGSTGTFNNNLAKIVDWQLIEPDGTVQLQSSSSSFSFTYTQSGIHHIHLTNSDGTTCNTSDSAQIIIPDNPAPPTSIESESPLCLQTSIQYYIPNLPNNHTVKWEIADGTIIPPSTKYGEKISVIWKSVTGPYVLSAYIIDSYGCESTIISKSLESNRIIEGLDTVCVGEEATYTLTEEEYNNEVRWYITPDHLSSRLSSEANQLRVLWLHEGTYYLRADYCHFSEYYEVEVIPPPMIDIVYEDTVCYNEQSNLIVNSTLGAYYEIYNDDNVVISTSSPTKLNPGSYEILYTDINGCQNIELIDVVELPSIDVQLKLGGSQVQCPPFSAMPIAVIDPDPTYSYAWFKNNLSLGTGTTILITDAGTYECIATNSNGCTAQSSVTISTCCGSTYCPSPPPLTIQKNDVDCYTKDFNVVPPFSSTAFTWNFGDNTTAVGNPVSHTYNKVGIYLVRVSGNENCSTITCLQCDTPYEAIVCETGEIIVIIPILADFEVDDVCYRDSTKLINESSKIESLTGETYHWDFGDSASGVNNNSNLFEPTHLYTSPGIYTVTLIMTEPSGCISEKIKQITVHPFPDATIIVDSESCFGEYVEFDHLGSDPDLKYLWNFGDTLSRLKNRSKLKSPSHLFTNIGIYEVSLTVTSAIGCVDSSKAIITIVENDLEGTIITTDLNPKCIDQTITLEAPTSISYLWSTAETTKTIQVLDPDVYFVTIENAKGCKSSSSPFIVENVELDHSIVFAKKYNPSGIGFSNHYDSLKICKGDIVDITCDAISGWDYKWNTSHTGKTISSHQINNYSLGRHWLDVDFKIGQCDTEAGPFLLEIIDIPSKPIIEIQDIFPCEDQISLLSLTNYNLNYEYIWSNGATGSSTTVSSAGSYYVSAYNELGCAVNSDTVNINPVPNINGWMTGCMEVCFPKDICLNIPNSFSIELIHDGVNMGPLLLTSDLISLTEPGDYQIISINEFGCKSTSDILSLTPSPLEQSLSGIVFYDDNDNMTFELGDSLLSNIPVYLFNGNTIVAQTTTDINGSYQFDSLQYSNLQVVIDPSSTGLPYQGIFDSTMIYMDCVEEKIIDFPLEINCFPSSIDTTFYICTGDSMSLGGTYYFENDKVTLDNTSTSGCDSTIHLEVLAYPTPDPAYKVSSSCENTSNGVITLHNLTEYNTQYSFTQGGSLLSDSIINNLSAGNYSFFFINEYGCQSAREIFIPTNPLPSIETKVDHNCPDQSNGRIEIMTDEFNLVSINNDPFSETKIFDHLAAGNYLIEVMDTFGCVNNSQVTITTLPSLDIITPTFDMDCYSNPVHISPEVTSHNGPIQYEWSNGSTASDYTVEESEIVQLTISDDCEEQYLEWELNLTILDDQDAYYIPNVFSPKGDLLNECFLISINNNYDLLSFDVSIYDRWGSLMHHHTDIDDCWDGTFQGQDAESGVYVYIIKMKISNCNQVENIQKVGDVTLVR